MKAVKCYGRRNINFIETDETKNLFDNLFCKRVKGPDCISKCIVNSIVTNSNNLLEVSLFNTSITEPIKQEDILEPNKTFKNKTFKHKLKSQKYKGKRKCRKVIKKLCNIPDNLPSFNSTINYELFIEPNSPEIANYHRKVLNEINLSRKNILQCSKSINVSNVNDSIVLSPVLKKSIKPKSKNKKLEKKCNLKNNEIPVTSTPKPLYLKYLPAVLNLSVIHTNHQGNKQTKKSISKSSSIHRKSCDRNVESFVQETSEKENDRLAQQQLQSSRIFHTTPARSLRNHTSLAEVSREEEPSILQQLLDLCNQNDIISFDNIYDWNKKTFLKVGEGSYGEVFMLTENKKSFIIKVIPVSDEFENNLQSMDSVYSEIKVAQILAKLRSDSNFQTKNFNLLKNVHVVQGIFPHKLLGAWDNYSETKTTYNDRPDIFDEKQIFVILELEYGGKDISTFVFRNAVEAESVFKQIAISLAIAEDSCLFEHRDLHLGNVLVQRNKSKKISYIFRGKSISLPSEGVIVSIIDFTLSRVLHKGCVYYNDLANDVSLFNQTGDIQFDVYKETKEKLNNQWHECLLFSNVLWLNFLCKKFQIHEYSRPSSKKHIKSLQNLKTYSINLDECHNSKDCLKICKIIDNLPDKIDRQDSLLYNSNTIFVDRKSLQKSSLYGKLF